MTEAQIPLKPASDHQREVSVRKEATEERQPAGEKRKTDAMEHWPPPQSNEKGQFHVVHGRDLTPRYKVIALLAEGTWSKVCELWDGLTKCHVACKILRSTNTGFITKDLEVEILTKLKDTDTLFLTSLACTAQM